MAQNDVNWCPWRIFFFSKSIVLLKCAVIWCVLLLKCTSKSKSKSVIQVWLLLLLLFLRLFCDQEASQMRVFAAFHSWCVHLNTTSALLLSSDNSWVLQASTFLFLFFFRCFYYRNIIVRIYYISEIPGLLVRTFRLTFLFLAVFSRSCFAEVPSWIPTAANCPPPAHK